MKEVNDRPFVKEVERRLQGFGWKKLGSPERLPGNGLTEFSKKNKHGSTLIKVALSADALARTGFYEIVSVEIREYIKPPYDIDGVQTMKQIIDDAALELLRMGIPFRPDYVFGRYLKECLEGNQYLRQKYRLESYELEDYGKMKKPSILKKEPIC